jgi:FtsZ-binding cell division protein ZapB
MPKRNVNAVGVNHLQLEVQNLNKENTEIRRENESLRNESMMVKETLKALVEDESYWSEEAIKSGIVWRLKNVLTQISS